VLTLVLLIFFLIQFLVALGALIFVIFLARPEVPSSGDGSLDKPSADDRDHLLPRPPEGKPPASGKNALMSSRKPTKAVILIEDLDRTVQGEAKNLGSCNIMQL